MDAFCVARMVWLPAVSSVTWKVPVPPLSVTLPGLTKAGSVEDNVTVPVKFVSTLFELSSAVIVRLNGLPAVTVVCGAARTKRVASAGFPTVPFNPIVCVAVGIRFRLLSFSRAAALTAPEAVPLAGANSRLTLQDAPGCSASVVVQSAGVPLPATSVKSTGTLNAPVSDWVPSFEIVTVCEPSVTSVVPAAVVVANVRLGVAEKLFSSRLLPASIT